MWNYQIVKEMGEYTIREVVYMDESKLWTKDEVSPNGESRNEMRHSIEMYVKDILKLPVLIVEEDKVIGEEPPLSTCARPFVRFW